MNNYLSWLEKSFVTEGGIKERMHKARTDYRNEVDSHLQELEKENQQLKVECKQWKDKYEELKSRALTTYHAQEQEVNELKSTLAVLKQQA